MLHVFKDASRLQCMSQSVTKSWVLATLQTSMVAISIECHIISSCGVPGVKDEIVAVLRGAGSNKEGELCVQAIFLLLDVLKKWAEDTKGTAPWSASGQA